MKLSKFKLLKVLRMFIATMASIWLATLLDVQFAFTAGVVGLLSVMDSTKVTIKSACQRLISILLGLLLSIVIFSLLGFNMWAFGLFLICYIIVCLICNLMIGVVPGAVIIGHILADGMITWDIIYNEIILVLIGVIVASIVNLFMISRFNEILMLRQGIENNLRQLFILFYSELYTSEYKQEIGHQIKQLTHQVDKAIKLTREEYDNKLLLSSRYDLRYFEMRRMQLNVLDAMYQNLFLLNTTSEQSKILANIFYLTSQQIREHNSGVQLKRIINNFYQHLTMSRLPQTREEFETRAILYHLLRDIEIYLKIKTNFYENISRERGVFNDDNVLI